MRNATALAAAAATVALVACGTEPGGAGEPTGVTVVGASVQRAASEASADEVRALAEAQVAFAVDLYRAVGSERDGDLVLGPSSLHTVLSMVGAGAREGTAAEMAEVLHVRLDDRLHDSANALDRELMSRSDTDGVELTTANRVWADDDLTLQADFVDVLAGRYGAAPATLDITSDPEAAREAVNAWAADRTSGLVEELFPPGTIDADTRLVLANAVHLDAQWKFPFDRVQTSDAPFQLGDGSTVDVPTMRYDEYLPSGRGPGWTAVRLPYDGEQLSMTVIVPDRLQRFEQELSSDLLAEVDASITDGGIHLSLPRFSAQSHLSLAETLAAMGMPAAFSDAADFSGMTGSRDLLLGPVEHEAVLEVDEAGTEAAAASGAGMLGSHGPTVDVDRPFLFVVRDDDTGAVLFLGRVTDPR